MMWWRRLWDWVTMADTRPAPCYLCGGTLAHDPGACPVDDLRRRPSPAPAPEPTVTWRKIGDPWPGQES